MRTRSLLFLAIAVAILATLAVWRSSSQRRAAGSDARAGAPLVNFDVNRVAALRVQTGTNTVALARREGRWVVETLYNYPADFERLAERLRDLVELKVGQLVPGGTDDLAEFGFDAAGNPTAVDFEDAEGRRLARLTLGRTRESRGGSPFGGFPDGQYVRVDEGPVILLGRVVSGFRADPRDWIKTDLLSVAPSPGAVVEATVGGETWRLRVGEGNKPELEVLAAGEELDESAARRATGALQYLTFLTVADPARSDEELGLTAPDRYVFRAPDGFVYTVLVGAPREDGKRYARVAVAFERPAPPANADVAAAAPDSAPTPAGEAATPKGEADESGKAAADDTAAKTSKKTEGALSDEEAARRAQRAAEEHERVSRWVYELSAWNAESLTLRRSQLIKAPTPSADAEPKTDSKTSAVDAGEDKPTDGGSANPGAPSEQPAVGGPEAE